MEIILERGYYGKDRFHRASTDKEFDHKYCSHFYEKEFASRKDLSITLFEIGIESGGSLLLWNEYFTNAQLIFGVDTWTSRAENSCRGLDKIKIMQTNAYETQFAQQLPNFDIIIDDGPHTEHSQLLSLQLYCSKLNTGGILVIEDIQDFSSIEKFIDLVPSGMQYEVIDIREQSKLSDSLLFVVRN